MLQLFANTVRLFRVAKQKFPAGGQKPIGLDLQQVDWKVTMGTQARDETQRA